MATHSSCLKNPRDGGAWWAAICGVAQSWTRLKRLSSSKQQQQLCFSEEFAEYKCPLERALKVLTTDSFTGWADPWLKALLAQDWELCMPTSLVGLCSLSLAPVSAVPNLTGQVKSLRALSEIWIAEWNLRSKGHSSHVTTYKHESGFRRMRSWGVRLSLCEWKISKPAYSFSCKKWKNCAVINIPVNKTKLCF